MKKRDQFALAAMHALLTADSRNYLARLGNFSLAQAFLDHAEQIATDAYYIADLMLEARNANENALTESQD